jgi:hypothetical protein
MAWPDIPFGDLNLAVAATPQPFQNARLDLAGVNSFGFGGSTDPWHLCGTYRQLSNSLDRRTTRPHYFIGLSVSPLLAQVKRFTPVSQKALAPQLVPQPFQSFKNDSVVSMAS